MFIPTILILICIGLISLSTWRFITEMLKHRKQTKKLDEWSKFHEQLLNWSREIVDSDIRVKFINECVNDLMYHSVNKQILDSWSFEKEKQKIVIKWGKHIPSLLQEVRHNKINKIIK